MSIILNLFFMFLLGSLFLSGNAGLIDLVTTNVLVQAALFLCVAGIPFLVTKRVSYVDIAWPFGVALIGLQIILFGESDLWRTLFVGGIYLFIGLRMGIGALVFGVKTGVIFKTEFPRYKYRRMLLEEKGSRHTDAHLFAEVMAQGAANMTCLALPGFLIALNSDSQFATIEIIGISLWAVAYSIESIADGQKLLYTAKYDNTKDNTGVCNIGLWKYSRHPNYFAEWLVWTGLVLAAIPSLMALEVSDTFWVIIAIGTASASAMLYITLVYLTGAKPAEYYSVRKRSGYREYQEKTNMFFPWFPKS